MVRNIFATVLPALGLVICNPAHADQDDFVRQVRVTYADLDLSREQDRKVLQRRVRAAITKVCAGDGIVPWIVEVARCREAAYASTHRQMELAYAKDARFAQAGRTSIGFGR